MVWKLVALKENRVGFWMIANSIRVRSGFTQD
jgi:hypothetical protein